MMAKISGKATALCVSVAIAATAFSAFAFTAQAYEAEISYADGKATATANGTLIAAHYNDNGTLSGAELYDAVANSEIPVELQTGDKLMLWDSSMQPLAEVYTAPSGTAAEESLNIIKEWKFDFGSSDDVAQGYTAVTADMNYTLNTVGDEQYGFIGTNSNDYKLGNRLDGFTTQKGQTITLAEGGGSGLYDAIGSTGADSYGNAGDKYYPVRFALKVEDETYYRVRATVTTLDPTKPATASLYTERKHPIFTAETIPAGGSITKEFTIRTTPIYYEKSDPKGTIADGMVNVSVLGTNSAFASVEIYQIDTAPVLWVLGDSTVTDGNCSLPFSPLQNYTGVGTGLSKYIPKNIALVNEGEGGLAAGDNNHFNMVRSRIKAGDYMYVEYGHNHKDDGPAGYVGNLDKYYQACKTAGATLIIVGPIDRHNIYDSATNTWSTSLAQFSRAGKGYVDTMMYGGETAAATFVSTYQSDGEESALAYRDGVVSAANGEKAVENIAFVDLNQPSLDWFAAVTASGSIGGVEVTNSSKLIDYYFQTSRGGKTDGTHPNDAGAENLAYLFFTTADTDAYPAITPLLENFMPGHTHLMPTPVEQAAMDAGSKAGQGNVGWPQYVVPTDNEYPNVIKSISFNDDGSVASATVTVQDAKFDMTAYGIIVITIKDENGDEIGKVYAVDQVDNSTGMGEQTIEHFTGDARLPEDGSYSAQVWQALDTSDGIKVDPEDVAYSAVYVPTDIVAYLLPGDSGDIETFDYYGVDNLTATGKYIWGGSATGNFALGTDGDRTYANVSVANAGNSFWLYRAFSNLDGGTGTTGKYMINADIKYISGYGLSIDLASSVKNSSPFVNDPYKLLSIGSNGALSVNGTSVGTLKSEVWTNVNYILDMGNGTATVSVDGAEPTVVSLPAYATFDATPNASFRYFVFDGAKGTTFANQFSNLTVAKLGSNDKTTLTVASEDGSMGSAYIGTAGTTSVRVPIATSVSATAVVNDGYRFVGWYEGEELLSENAVLTIARLYRDLDITARFALNTTPATVTVNYLDGNGSALKAPTVITEDGSGNTLYAGDAFALDNSYISTIKTSAAADGAFSVYEFDSAHSDAMTIAELSAQTTVNLVFTQRAGRYFAFDDCSGLTSSNITANGWTADYASIMSSEENGQYLYYTRSDNKAISPTYTAAAFNKSSVSEYVFEADMALVAGNTDFSSVTVNGSDGASFLTLNNTVKPSSKTTSLTWSVNGDESDLITLAQAGVGSAPWTHFRLVVNTQTNNVDLTITQSGRTVYQNSYTASSTGVITGFTAALGRAYPKASVDNVMLYTAE